MHLFLKNPKTGKCPKCGKDLKPHIACPSCGFYKGVEVVNVLKKLDRKERKAKELDMKRHEMESKQEASAKEAR